MTDTKAGRDPEGALKDIEAQAQEPAGPQGDLAAWRDEAERLAARAGIFLEHRHIIEAVGRIVTLRQHLAAMPQAQPDAELLKALKDIHGICGRSDDSDDQLLMLVDDEARAAIAQAETGAAG